MAFMNTDLKNCEVCVGMIEGASRQSECFQPCHYSLQSLCALVFLFWLGVLTLTVILLYMDYKDVQLYSYTRTWMIKRDKRNKVTRIQKENSVKIA